MAAGQGGRGGNTMGGGYPGYPTGKNGLGVMGQPGFGMQPVSPKFPYQLPSQPGFGAQPNTGIASSGTSGNGVMGQPGFGMQPNYNLPPQLAGTGGVKSPYGPYGPPGFTGATGGLQPNPSGATPGQPSSPAVPPTRAAGPNKSWLDHEAERLGLNTAGMNDAQKWIEYINSGNMDPGWMQAKLNDLQSRAGMVPINAGPDFHNWNTDIIAALKAKLGQ